MYNKTREMVCKIRYVKKERKKKRKKKYNNNKRIN